MPSSAKPSPRVVIFAGPNGAGKSTHADGHNVPSDVIRRRFGRSLSNFFTLYAPLADEWAVFDNSPSPQAIQVATKFATQLNVMEPVTWHKLQKLSQVV